MSLVSSPARNRSVSRPLIQYLNSGEASKTPTPLRIAKYSCFEDMSYFTADRCPDQWVHSPVRLRGASRSWNGVVFTMDGASHGLNSQSTPRSAEDPGAFRVEERPERDPGGDTDTRDVDLIGALGQSRRRQRLLAADLGDAAGGAEGMPEAAATDVADGLAVPVDRLVTEEVVLRRGEEDGHKPPRPAAG